LQGERGLPGKDGQDGENGKDGSPDAPEDIVKKLESLEGEERLDSSAIKNLDNRINEIRVGGRAKAFIGLADTPSSYQNQAGKSVRVKSDERSLEFYTPSAGITDHGALTGLGDDDHSQYFNQVRGDARYSQLGHTHDDRYFTETESDARFAPISHIHSIAQVTNLQSTLDGKQLSDSTLTALAAYNTNGILTQTAADTFTGRTITGTANQITVSNGNGVAGNPTLSLPQDIHTSATPQFARLGLGVAADATCSLTTSSHILMGTTRRMSLVVDFNGNGEIPPGGFFGSFGSNGYTMAPSTDNGTAGAKITGCYYNGAAWYSAWEVANVSGGGGARGTLSLMKSGGNVVIGTSIATTATDGFLYIPTMAGSPTGVPTALAGRVPQVYDTTNNKLWIYNGGWKSALFT